VFDEVVKDFPCACICGHRGPEEQDRAYRAGASKLKWPNSKHNILASEAADVLPLPVPTTSEGWEDPRYRELICTLAGWTLRTAKECGVPLVWGGGKCSSDMSECRDFNWDLAHYEMRLRRST
jgi:peptidoglycan L-alanyl-D-glutamate endopeptidase CwlK